MIETAEVYLWGTRIGFVHQGVDDVSAILCASRPQSYTRVNIDGDAGRYNVGGRSLCSGDQVNPCGAANHTEALQQRRDLALAGGHQVGQFVNYDVYVAAGIRALSLFGHLFASLIDVRKRQF